MKCIKNSKNGNIIRVEDLVANRMVGSEWSFVSKNEWKKVIGGETKEEVILEEAPKKNKKVKNDRKA
jgi:hypothetical protein